jgi:hypothetical protein
MKKITTKYYKVKCTPCSVIIKLNNDKIDKYESKINTSNNRIYKYGPNELPHRSDDDQNYAKIMKKDNISEYTRGYYF